MLTIKDIAKLAGVSYSTVSKALNQDPRIKPATRRKVLDIAEKHGYRKNILATQLVSGKSRIIGFVLGELSNPLYPLIAKMLDAELNKRGYRMISVLSSEGIDLFYQLKVDGCIVWDSTASRVLEQMRGSSSASIPCFILTPVDDPDSPYMKIDRKEIIGKAIDYLVSYGHKRIGFIGNTQEIKLQGYKEGLERNGLQYSAEHILPANSTWEDGYLAMLNYRFTSESPTAFIGLNNLVTKGAMRALLQKGLKVPGHVSLIGYDHLPDMQHAEVAITTVGPSLEELTSQAADQIIALVSGEAVEQPLVIEPRLYERNSVAKPRSD